MFTIEKEDMDWFIETIHKLSGISMTPAKKELIQSRLRPRIVSMGYKSFGEYKEHLKALDRHDAEWQELINLLTTNKTDFFREKEHFDWLVQVFLPEWLKLRKPTLRCWCAACSTGEEPYTLAMLLRRSLPEDISIQVLATDIDTKVLEVAKNGVYPKDRLSLVPPEYINYAFIHGTGDIKGWSKIKKDLKTVVSFQHFNLTSTFYPWRNTFDIIFCRNVFIYFTPPTIEKIVQNLQVATQYGGVFFIGQSESLQNVKHSWRYIQPSIFQKA